MEKSRGLLQLQQPNQITNASSYSVLEDYLETNNDFLWKRLLKNLPKKFLNIHGSEDKQFRFQLPKILHFWAGNLELILVGKGNHTFGVKELWLDLNYLLY